VLSPTQTIVVTVPTDTLDKLAPHQSGLPQSWATIIAALIAVAAACIAFSGVLLQIRATAAQAEANRHADAELAREERHAQAAAARRGERIKLVREATDLTQTAFNHAIGLAVEPESKTSGQDVSNLMEAVYRGFLTRDMMLLVGLRKSAAGLNMYMEGLRDTVEAPNIEDVMKVAETRSDLLQLFVEELEADGLTPTQSQAT
jgi:hypothetical protein